MSTSEHFGFSFIRVEGNDAAKFLQGQLTCDLNALNIGEACLGAQCTPKGRVIHNFICGRTGENCYHLQLPNTMQETAIAALKKYAVFFKVSITADDTLEPIHHQQPLLTLSPLATFALSETLNVSWIKTGSDLSSLNLIAPHFAYLQHKLAFIEPNTTDMFTPEELGLDLIGAINFKKGCYTGQEIIARMHYKGAHKRGTALFQATTSLVATPGESITHEDKNIGTLIAIARDNHSTPYVLASLPKELFEASTLQIGEQTLTPVKASQ